MRLLVSSLSFFVLLVELDNLLLLRPTILFIKQELMLEPLLANHDTLLIYDVIELSVVFLENLILLLFFFFIIFQVLVTSIQRSIVVVLLFVLIVELLKDVLDLSFELLVRLVHQVLQHFAHAQRLCFLSQLFPCKNRVKCTIYVRADLQVVMFYQVGKHSQQLDVWVFTLVLA